MQVVVTPPLPTVALCYFSQHVKNWINKMDKTLKYILLICFKARAWYLSSSLAAFNLKVSYLILHVAAEVPCSCSALKHTLVGILIKLGSHYHQTFILKLKLVLFFTHFSSFIVLSLNLLFPTKFQTSHFFCLRDPSLRSYIRRQSYDNKSRN